MNKNVLIICYSHHHKEPRLLMQCSALKTSYQVTTAGFSSVKDDSVRFIQLTKEIHKAPISFHSGLPLLVRAPFSFINKIYFALFGLNPAFSKTDLEALSRQKYDLVIAHHPETIELALELKAKSGCKLIFNAHEIYPFEFESDKQWMEANSKPLDELLKQRLPEFDRVFTVNKEIAEFYASRYRCKAIAVHNSKKYFNAEPTPVKDPIRIIHHGGAMKQRKLEQMADAVLECGKKFDLTFMITNTNGRYLDELKATYEPQGVKFAQPVSYEEIVAKLNAYDIGLYILPNDTINHDLALPNKIFEFVQAKLALVTSPNSAIKNFISTQKTGVVARSFDAKSMAETLKALTKEDVQRFKQNSASCSKQNSSEKDEQIIYENVKELLK